MPDQGLLRTPLGSDAVAAPKSGMVNADGGALMAAGLHPQAQYHEYAFVTFEPPAPGRYNLFIQTVEAYPELAGFDSELLASYTRVGK